MSENTNLPRQWQAAKEELLDNAMPGTKSCQAAAISAIRGDT